MSVFLKSIEFKHIWLWPLCVCCWPLRRASFFCIWLQFTRRGSLSGEQLLRHFFFFPPAFVFSGPRWMGQRAQKTSASPPPSWLWCPSALIFRQKPPLFYAAPPFASRVITYHQSKLIIADWVGVVNDYRRGRTGAVSLAPFCSQWWTWQKGRRAWRERGRGGEEGGGATRLFGLHWETTASQDGQKVRGWIRKWSVIWGRWMSPQGNTPFSFLLYCRW